MFSCYRGLCPLPQSPSCSNALFLQQSRSDNPNNASNTLLSILPFHWSLRGIQLVAFSTPSRDTTYSFNAYTLESVFLWTVSLVLGSLLISPRRFKKLRNIPVVSVLIHVLLRGIFSLFLCKLLPMGSIDLAS